jgi:hypothetical protein
VVPGRAIPPEWGMYLRRWARVGGCLAAVALAGCGGHAKPKPPSVHRAAVKPAPVCLPGAVVALARVVGAPVGDVSAKPGTGNNGEPQCSFSVRGPRVSVVVNLDSSPQPYQRLERLIVEDGQQFGTERNFSPPETVTHLGLDAAWVPDLSELITTDGKRLITVTVGWRGSRMAMGRALARTEAKLYLEPLNRKAAEVTEA